MNTPYNFTAHTPPILNEAKIIKKLKRKKLIRQTRLIRLASAILSFSFLLFAFFILRDSLIVAILSVFMLCISLIGNGLISLVFWKKGFLSE